MNIYSQLQKMPLLYFKKIVFCVATRKNRVSHQFKFVLHPSFPHSFPLFGQTLQWKRVLKCLAVKEQMIHMLKNPCPLVNGIGAQSNAIWSFHQNSLLLLKSVSIVNQNRKPGAALNLKSSSHCKLKIVRFYPNGCVFCALF